MHSHLGASLGVYLLLHLFTSVAAQEPAFEVASIKESPEGSRVGGMRPLPDGGLIVQAMPVDSIIRTAFRVQPYLMIYDSAPAWFRESRYDITARPATPTAPAQAFVMLRSLLAERFKFTYHRETREMEGYELVRSRPDRLGPNLQVSKLDCTVAPRPQECQLAVISQTSMEAVGVPLMMLLSSIAAELERPVIDKTGLDGRYDIQLKWARLLDPSADLPTLSTALQEQLGLKLERRRMPVEVFVIDSIVRPTPD